MTVAGDDFVGLKESLTSVKDYIDYWVIADLEMSDRSEQLIEEILADVEGEIVATDSTSNIASRNALLAYSADKADYLLILDSNTRLSFQDGVEDWRQRLCADAYLLLDQGRLRRAELRLINAKLDWQYHGVTSEFLVCSSNTNPQLLSGVSILKMLDPETEAKKARVTKSLLEAHLVGNPEDGHTLFHLAKTLMNTGEHQQALDTFEEFIQTPQKWDPEWQWYALYCRAKLLEGLEFEFAEIVAAYEQTYKFRCKRAEPLYELARLYREKEQYVEAHFHAHKAFTTPFPESETYDLDLNIYQWLIPNEYAMACQKLGYLEDAVIACNKAIEHRNQSKNLFRSMVASRERSLAELRSIRQSTPKDVRNRIRVVVPFRNAGALLADAAKSLLTQDYPNFSATFIDDCSTDGSSDYVPGNDDRIELIVNTERLGPMVNRMNFINSCEPSDIVVYLDGDDQLASDDVLSYINHLYNRYDCWLSYGQYLSQQGNLGFAQPYPNQKSLIDALESGSQRFPIHPVTHRAALFHRLRDFDPNLSCFKDDDGEWLFYASDAVLTRPLFYMAGYDRIHYCDRVLYLYTEGHEISESISNKKDQIDTCKLVTTRMRPPKLNSLEF